MELCGNSYDFDGFFQPGESGPGTMGTREVDRGDLGGRYWVPSPGPHPDVAADFSGEELAHGVVGGVSSVGRVDGLLGPDVAEDFLTVAEELVEEESVGDKH